jgi:hypothetical protein
MAIWWKFSSKSLPAAQICSYDSATQDFAVMDNVFRVPDVNLFGTQDVWSMSQ